MIVRLLKKSAVPSENSTKAPKMPKPHFTSVRSFPLDDDLFADCSGSEVNIIISAGPKGYAAARDFSSKNQITFEFHSTLRFYYCGGHRVATKVIARKIKN